MTSTEPIVVDAWTVTMAIRYGLGRSLAHADAIALIREHWTQLNFSAKASIMHELGYQAERSQWRDVADSSAQTLEWCEHVEESLKGNP